MVLSPTRIFGTWPLPLQIGHFSAWLGITQPLARIKGMAACNVILPSNIRFGAWSAGDLEAFKTTRPLPRINSLASTELMMALAPRRGRGPAYGSHRTSTGR